MDYKIRMKEKTKQEECEEEVDSMLMKFGLIVLLWGYGKEVRVGMRCRCGVCTGLRH